MMRDAGIGSQGRCWRAPRVRVKSILWRGCVGLFLLSATPSWAMENAADELVMAGGVLGIGLKPAGPAHTGWRIDLQAGEKEALRLEAPHHFRVTDWRGFDYLVVEAGNEG